MSPPSSATEINKQRYLGFLIWQTIQSALIYSLSKPLFFPSSFLTTLLFLPVFLLSMLLFSFSLHSLSSPPAPASGFRLFLSFLLLHASSSLSGFFAVLSLLAASTTFSFPDSVSLFGPRGFAAGFLYSLFSVFYFRWLLLFPILQRPPFYSYKMGLPSAIRQALKLSLASTILISIPCAVLVPNHHKRQVAGGYLSEHFTFFIASFAVILSWELILHLHKVLHTKRFVFAPSKGSAAAETNPSEPLLTALEESPPRCLLQYLAYLDLSMVCGSNVDPWRRAAFFEETGATYKRVVTACLRPLEQLTSKLAEGLVSSGDSKLSHQLRSPDDIRHSSEILESFNDFQLYGWCAQAIASLEVRSHKEDRFGVAQLSGSHSCVLSTLLSCLLAVETFMGKKINFQSPNHMLGPAGIKWATNSAARREMATAMNKKRGSPSHLKSYALADVLKTSIYSIVSEFHEEMLASAKLGLLEKDWLSSGKPVYGSVGLLVQKLQYFLNFQAS